jgi:hypothetical protein
VIERNIGRISEELRFVPVYVPAKTPPSPSAALAPEALVLYTNALITLKEMEYA